MLSETSGFCIKNWAQMAKIWQNLSGGLDKFYGYAIIPRCSSLGTKTYPFISSKHGRKLTELLAKGSEKDKRARLKFHANNIGKVMGVKSSHLGILIRVQKVLGWMDMVSQKGESGERGADSSDHRALAHDRKRNVGF